jgi:NAD(P)-dependent dehydrogenase (short-subunit alcohol dehydrogenase family)
MEMRTMASDKRVWLITGASRGLGRELAKLVLARGEIVIGTSRDGKIDLDADNGTLHKMALDLARPGRESEVIGQAHALHGRLDVLVNNAGFGLLGAVEEATETETAQVFNVNFFGPLRLIQAALPLLRAQGSGHIVNLSSIAGIAPGAGSGLYAAAKFALEGMSESLVQEVGPLGIRVTVVEPGAFRTDFLSSKSIRHTSGQLEDYAGTSGKLVAYLAEMEGKQLGDPVKGARAIVDAIDSPEPPLHLLLGSDSLRRAREKLKKNVDEFDRWEAVTLGTDFPKGE